MIFHRRARWMFSELTKLQHITQCCVGTYSGLRPRRTLLYVPGNEEKKVKKAASLNADVVVMDCEDGVALTMKEEARSCIQKWLPVTDFGQSESVVRINSIDSPFAEEDLKSVLTSDHLPNAIMIPKIETSDQIHWLYDQAQKHLDNTGHHNTTLKVIGQSETPLGMMNLRSILEAATRENSRLKFEAFVFGSDDYLASIGAVRTKDAVELLFARQLFIMHVKGFGMQAIDMVDINFKDLDGLREQSEAGSRMGFTGKHIIHPAQIDIVNESFSPSQKNIEFAEGMIAAFDEHQLSGKGAFTYCGSMIDMPSVKQAQNVVYLAKLVKS